MIRASLFSLMATLANAAAAQGTPAAARPAAPVVDAATAIELPEWLYPIDPKSLRPSKGGAAKEPSREPPKPDEEPLTVPGSSVALTRAQINDPFLAPDWRPDAHGPMPEIVAKGHKPDGRACAFCHSPTGQGRPENASIAGLPEAYIRQQMLDFRSGARPPAGPDAYLPSRNMHLASKRLTDQEIDEAARYFAQQKLRRRVWVIEGLRMPRVEPAAWVYAELGGMEDVEVRVIEATPDLELHERRDDRLEYHAYVPPGAIAAGKLLVTKGGKTQICATCHLQNLRGTDQIPPINGRSPTYVLRQLLAFHNGTRSNAQAAQMKPVVEKLDLEDMIAISAYLGSLYP